MPDNTKVKAKEWSALKRAFEAQLKDPAILGDDKTRLKMCISHAVKQDVESIVSTMNSREGDTEWREMCARAIKVAVGKEKGTKVFGIKWIK